MAEPLYLNITGNLSVNGCCVWFCTRRGNEAIGKTNPTRNLEPALLKRQGSACPDLRPTTCMWPHDPQKRLYPRGKQCPSWSHATSPIPWVFLFTKCDRVEREGCSCALMKGCNRTSWGTALVHWVNGALTARFLLTEMAGVLLNSPAPCGMHLSPLSPIHFAPS